jgi:hypothetical protein
MLGVRPSFPDEVRWNIHDPIEDEVEVGIDFDVGTSHV